MATSGRRSVGFGAKICISVSPHHCSFSRSTVWRWRWGRTGLFWLLLNYEFEVDCSRFLVGCFFVNCYFICFYLLLIYFSKFFFLLKTHREPRQDGYRNAPFNVAGCSDSFMAFYGWPALLNAGCPPLSPVHLHRRVSHFPKKCTAQPACDKVLCHQSKKGPISTRALFIFRVLSLNAPPSSSSCTRTVAQPQTKRVTRPAREKCVEFTALPHPNPPFHPVLWEYVWKSVVVLVSFHTAVRARQPKNGLLINWAENKRKFMFWALTSLLFDNVGAATQLRTRKHTQWQKGRHEFLLC